MKLLLVVGARPNVMKAAPLVWQLVKRGVEHKVVNVRQHYSAEMIDTFLDDLNLVVDRIALTHEDNADRIGNMIQLFASACKEYNPTAVIVFGDIDAAMACAVAAYKLDYPVVHVEAGLRSWDLKMPEEINRRIIDDVSTLHLCSEDDGALNLAKDHHKTAHLVGNLMIDTLYDMLRKDPISGVNFHGDNVERTKIEDYVLATFHRGANVDDPENLQRVVRLLEDVADYHDVRWVMHPRTIKRIFDFKITVHPKITVLKPRPYGPFIRFVAKSRAVITDSGGIQEETSAMGVPCVTVRSSTERPCTLSYGTNHLVPLEASHAIPGIIRRSNSNKTKMLPLWDGKAAVRACNVLMAKFS